jgi:S-DNA-T family DNA segregation ATPase FtsK/SpoIIIE
LIIATQRPSTDFVVGTLKANLPTRISFRLPQRTDSMVILDQPGAERLLGAGDMLLLNEGRVQRLQGYFAATDEISRFVSERIQHLQGEENHE